MSLQTLYEKDFYSWINKNVLLLKAHKLEKLDVEHLIEELEGMARSQKRALINRLVSLLCHMLKWDYQMDRRSKSWENTIREQQFQIQLLLEDSPSLKITEDILKKAYGRATEKAFTETKGAVSQKLIPEKCPYTVKEILSRAI